MQYTVVPEHSCKGRQKQHHRRASAVGPRCVRSVPALRGRRLRRLVRPDRVNDVTMRNAVTYQSSTRRGSDAPSSAPAGTRTGTSTPHSSMRLLTRPVCDLDRDRAATYARIFDAPATTPTIARCSSAKGPRRSSLSRATISTAVEYRRLTSRSTACEPVRTFGWRSRRRRLCWIGAATGLV